MENSNESSSKDLLKIKKKRSKTDDKKRNIKKKENLKNSLLVEEDNLSENFDSNNGYSPL